MGSANERVDGHKGREEFESAKEILERLEARGIVFDDDWHAIIDSMDALRESMCPTKDEMDTTRDRMNATGDRVDALKDSFETVKLELALLEPFHNEILRSRAALLGHPAEVRNETLAGGRLSPYIDTPPHGGNIIVDLTVIDRTISEGEGDRLAGRKNVFERLYRVAYDWGKDEIRNAPENIRTAFDIRADVSELDVWQTGKAAAAAEETIKPGCEKILEKWERWVRGGKEGEMPDIQGEFNSVKERYDKIWLGLMGF
ncbi:hypothetical protein FQN54_006928 [Arachnomyces sp. PD_36]|nr:hypothetical protein FQN54_006928 [Arachnomyces sp. PD_36]